MHLTNYAINKHHENFVRDDNTGSKRYCVSPTPSEWAWGPPVVVVAKEGSTGTPTKAAFLDVFACWSEL